LTLASLLVRFIVCMRTLFRNQSFILTRPPTLVLQMHLTFSRRYVFFYNLMLSFPSSRSFLPYYRVHFCTTFATSPPTALWLEYHLSYHITHFAEYISVICILTSRRRLNLSYLTPPSAKPLTPQLQRRVYSSFAVSGSPQARRMMIRNFEHSSHPSRYSCVRRPRTY
jgi:hypothetical protein